MKKIVIIFLLLITSSVAKIPDVEFQKFCASYMPWVNKYPHLFSAGYCNPNHISNKILRKAVGGL